MHGLPSLTRRAGPLPRGGRGEEPVPAAPRNPRERKGEEGIVLIITLWVVLVLSTIAASYAYMTKVDYEVTRFYGRSVQAEMLAKAGVNRAIIMLREDMLKDIDDAAYEEDELIIEVDEDDRFEYDSWDEAWHDNPDFYNGIEIAITDVISGSFTVRVVDEGSKLDLNADQAGAEMWRQLMVILGMDEDDAEPIAAAIVDWRDSDDAPTILDEEGDETGDEGTEATYYNPDQSDDEIEEIGPDYALKNGNYDMVEELLLVKGVTPVVLWGEQFLKEEEERGFSDRRSMRSRLDEYPGLYNYVTAYNHQGKMNINTLQYEPLAAVLAKIRDYDDAEDLAEDIIDYRNGSDRDPGGDDDKPMRTTDETDGDDAHFTEVDDFTQDDLTRLSRWGLVGITSDAFTITSTGEVDGVRKTYRVIVKREYLPPDSLDYERFDKEGEPLPELARVVKIAFSEEG